MIRTEEREIVKSRIVACHESGYSMSHGTPRQRGWHDKDSLVLQESRRETVEGVRGKADGGTRGHRIVSSSTMALDFDDEDSSDPFSIPGWYLTGDRTIPSSGSRLTRDFSLVTCTSLSICTPI